MKGTLQIINSRRDSFGNCYYSFIFTEKESGKEVKGIISGGESNLISSTRYIAGNGKDLSWGETEKKVDYYTEELGIREYNRLTKGWPYAGCPAEDIAKFILDSLK